MLNATCKSGLVAACYFLHSFYVLVQWISHLVLIPLFVYSPHTLRKISGRRENSVRDDPSCQWHTISIILLLSRLVRTLPLPLLHRQLIVTRHYCYIQSPVTSLWRYMSCLYGRGRELLLVCCGWLVIWLLYELSYLTFRSLPVNLRTTWCVKKCFVLIKLYFLYWFQDKQ